MYRLTVASSMYGMVHTYACTVCMHRYMYMSAFCMYNVCCYLRTSACTYTYVYVHMYVYIGLQWLAVITATGRLILEMYIIAHLRYTHTHGTEAT